MNNCRGTPFCHGLSTGEHALGCRFVEYHVIGLGCPMLPRDLMGTRHGVTQFPDSASCRWCKIEWDRLHQAGELTVDSSARIIATDGSIDWDKGMPSGLVVKAVPK